VDVEFKHDDIREDSEFICEEEGYRSLSLKGGSMGFELEKTWSKRRDILR
jgi:hypothetical protein